MMSITDKWRAVDQGFQIAGTIITMLVATGIAMGLVAAPFVIVPIIIGMITEVVAGLLGGSELIHVVIFLSLLLYCLKYVAYPLQKLVDAFQMSNCAHSPDLTDRDAINLLTQFEKPH